MADIQVTFDPKPDMQVQADRLAAYADKLKDKLNETKEETTEEK